MNKTIIQEHLVSALQTFIAVMGLEFFTSLTSGNVEWTQAALIGALLAALRSAVKEVFARFAPKVLGGRK